VFLLFAELLRHKPTLHDFRIALFPPKSPDVLHGDRSQLSRSPIGQIQVSQLTLVSYLVYVSSVAVRTSLTRRCSHGIVERYLNNATNQRATRLFRECRALREKPLTPSSALDTSELGRDGNATASRPSRHFHASNESSVVARL